MTTAQMNTYPELIEETKQMIAWLDTLMNRDDEDRVTIIGFVANTYAQSLSLLQSALDNDPENPFLKAAFDIVAPVAVDTAALAARMHAEVVEQAKQATKH